jgi:hypothetical protein
MTETPRPKPVRITIDLDPELYDGMKLWTVHHRAKLSDVTRSLYRRLLTDPEFAASIAADLSK